jgi:mediator of RNA polymerase II transcription subunit 6
MSVSQERERESAVSTAAPTPKPAGGAPGEGETRRKGSKGGMDLTKLKRRKSKGLASPVTPKEGSLMGGK